MKDLIKKVPLFQSLDDEQLESIASLCRRKSYPAGSTLFKENDAGSDFYILLKGSVKIYTSNKNGEEKILTVLKEGESFGELSLIDGKPRSASASTLVDSILYTLNGDTFLDLLRNDFNLTKVIMRELCQRLRDTNQHVHDLTFLDARSRVLKNLIVMANRHGIRSGNMISIRMDLDYEELSRMAGVSMNVLRNVLSELESMRILGFGPHEFTLDLSRLRA